MIAEASIIHIYSRLFMKNTGTLRKGIKVYLRDVHWRVSRVYLRGVFLVYLPTDAHVPTLK
jgi:hypothetical protein